MSEPQPVNPPTSLATTATAGPPRTDPWSEPTQVTVHYLIVANAEADIPCRLLNGFAQQSLLPCHVELRRRGPLLEIEIRQSRISWHRAELIAQRMRALVDVCSVQLQVCQEPFFAPSSAIHDWTC